MSETKIRNNILTKKNIPIILVLTAAAVIRLAILFVYGADYSLNSDDLSYINAAKTFCETGQITMHSVISAQIMPGMIWLLSPFVLIFKEGIALWTAVKLFWLVMSLFSIYGVYRIVMIYAPRPYAVVATIFFLAIDFAWMDNLILTETPFMLSLVYLVYASLQLARTQKKKYFWQICFWYMCALLLKATIAPYPVFLFVYLWLKKYDMRLMFRQMGIAILIVLAFIIPWSVRNYIRFDHFIPLTYGAGNPKLLGSYQGNLAPLDEDLDYQTNVYDKMPEEMRKYYADDGTLRPEYEGDGWYEDYMAAYYSLELDGMKADYRISVWREEATRDYLVSTFVKKPYMMVYNSFYWEDMFGIPISVNYWFRRADLLLFAAGCIGILLNRGRWKEGMFLMSEYLFQILVYAFTFSYGRYAQTLYFFRFIIIGWGLYELVAYLNRKKQGIRSDDKGVGKVQ